MPNWCSNTVKIGCTKTETLEEIKNLISSRKEDQGIFQATVGLFPKEYLYDKSIPFQSDTIIDEKYFDWYNHNVNEYGTKWDVNEQELSITEGHDCIYLYFDSAWSPPVEWASKLSFKFACQVEIEFSEPGCDFGGKNFYDCGDLVMEENYSYLVWLLKSDRDKFWNEIEYITEDYDKEQFEEYRSGVLDDISDSISTEDANFAVGVFNEIYNNMFVEE
jgi:hypothetical protein